MAAQSSERQGAYPSKTSKGVQRKGGVKFLFCRELERRYVSVSLGMPLNILSHVPQR